MLGSVSVDERISDDAMTIEPFTAKSIVRPERGTDNVHLNPYQGCYHDCVYCDGKAEDYYMHEDFGSRIRVKVNAPQLLEKYLQKKGFKKADRLKTANLFDDIAEDSDPAEKFTIGISGGVCDIYQPAEKVTQISRRLLQVVCDYGFPVFLLTKSKLILRDIDLLEKINRQAQATVCISAMHVDERIQRIFEPRASTTEERFDALRKLHDAGIHCGIWFMPILPWIADTDENMDSVFQRAKEIGVERIDCGGLTLKPGRQKRGFFNVLAEHFPHLLENYTLLYGNDDRNGSPDWKQFRRLGLADIRKKAKDLGNRHKVPVWAW